MAKNDLPGALYWRREESFNWVCIQIPKCTARAHFPKVRRALCMREAQVKGRIMGKTQAYKALGSRSNALFVLQELTWIS